MSTAYYLIDGLKYNKPGAIKIYVTAHICFFLIMVKGKNGESIDVRGLGLEGV